MSIYGYANASAIGLNAEEQFSALMVFGILKKNTVIEEQTGKSTAGRSIGRYSPWRIDQ